ncbi:hypothetical protein [Phaeobacter gallaeciensis]|uniref:hypothetical protein n=1 Tax=Phaeobacter gallaeciensis TaxID=60890 RepID=UPI00237EF874|nr:hypothetical protein [Phaeobacter gallaeciensis]MDE4063863.1 hypothetical protein [Phaeobacter gallaeciensis]MDE4126886.1 hypothetical protein [Phaeobacter gallaeciensis]MDE4131358.1 hypothetical protein [Phaeobacter gallaeciensis]
MELIVDPNELSEKSRKRQEAIKQRRQRLSRKPAKVPTELARSGMFRPTKQYLNQQTTSYTLEVGNWAKISVVGKELGIAHKDTLMAVFRQNARTIMDNSPESSQIEKWGIAAKTKSVVYTTWRGLLQAQNKSAHVNNITTQAGLLEDLSSLIVSFRIHEGRRGGGSGSLIEVLFDGFELDSRVQISYGQHVKQIMAAKQIVYLDAEAYYTLKSDYAKAFFSFIDSQPNNSWVDESILAQIVGRDIWRENWQQRGDFRKYCVRAFNDFEASGYLRNVQRVPYKSGKNTCFRFEYEFCKPKQKDLFPCDPSEVIRGTFPFTPDPSIDTSCG